MKTNKLKSIIWSVGLLVGLLGFFTLCCFSQSAQAVGKDERKRALLATVRLAAPIDGQGDEQSTGSGAIIDDSGHILTSYSVIGDTGTGKPYNSEGLVYVAVSPADLKGLPVWKYRATLVQGDPRLDLAVLKIDAPFNGSGSLPDNLGLITMVLGDSDGVGIGDEVTILGYVKSTASSVGFSSGSITGLLDEDGNSEVDGFSTDAPIDAGRIGGAAIDEAGAMIGVPGSAPDGTSHIRVMSLAKKLINAATSGLSAGVERGAAGAAASSTVATPEQPASTQITSGAGAAVEAVSTPTVAPSATPTVEVTGTVSLTPTVEIAPTIEITGTEAITPTVEITSTVENAPTPGPRISELAFSDRVDRGGSPGVVATSFSAGVKTVYAVFTYEEFEDGLPFDAAWVRDGETAFSESFEWDGGASGSSWVSMADDNGIASGSYVLTLSLDGAVLTSASLSVAEAPKPPAGPVLSSLVFAEDVTTDGKPARPHALGEPFAAGTSRVFAIFDYSGMQNGMKVSRDWLIEGEVEAQAEEAWQHGESGTQWVYITAQPSLPAGNFGLRMYVEGRLAAEGEFKISAATPVAAQPYIGSIVFAEGVTADGRPIRPHAAKEPFAAGTKEVYAFFDFSGMEELMAWSHNWYIDGVEVAADGADDVWDAGQSGNDWVRIHASQELPQGRYRLELHVEGELLSEGEFDLAGVDLPVDSTDVTVAGWLLDSDTWLAIPGAEIVALKPGVRARTFLRNPREELIYAYGQADYTGYFVLDEPLERGVKYSFVAAAEGYQDLTEDDVLITEDSDDYEEWEIYLQRR